jgi:hypothetical protein
MSHTLILFLYKLLISFLANKDSFIFADFFSLLKTLSWPQRMLDTLHEAIVKSIMRNLDANIVIRKSKGKIHRVKQHLVVI